MYPAVGLVFIKSDITALFLQRLTISSTKRPACYAATKRCCDRGPLIPLFARKTCILYQVLGVPSDSRTGRRQVDTGQVRALYLARNCRVSRPSIVSSAADTITHQLRVKKLVYQNFQSPVGSQYRQATSIALSSSRDQCQRQ